MVARVLGLLLLVSACKTSSDAGTGGSAAGPATAVVSTELTKATGSTNAASSSTPTPTPPPASGPPASGDALVLELASGATLKMPPDATASPMKDADKRLPGVVKHAHKYQLGGSVKRLLLVNEMDREGLTCSAVLDRELERATKAKGDTDPQKLALRRMDAVSTIEIAGQRALYAESKNSARSATGDTPPAVGVSTLMMCREREGGGDFVVMMFASGEEEKPDVTKKMLSDIAASYAPPD